MNLAAAHDEAVARLIADVASRPDDRVRLAKRTSNLFRFSGEPRVGLDVSGFGRVLGVDRVERTADVQGMTTYEDLVEATLVHNLMPKVVPQLKTITLGGAVSGLGIESTSFRSGLPHESVREMDILTGTGEVLTVGPTEHADLFRGFPNSYGTLGYALRLRIDLEPVKPFVKLHHRRFANAEECFAALPEIAAGGAYDFIDGVVFDAGELYLTLAEMVDEVPFTSDYTGQDVFYASIRRKTTDYLTIHDYLWRWDTDWFWCSAALGAQNPVVRRLWPRRYRRSDVYRRLVALDRQWGLSDRWEWWNKRPPREAVIQDVEVPVARAAEFLDFFHREIGISPVWVCPLAAQSRWPLYPLEPGELYVNFGFWSTVALRRGMKDGDYNRLIEAKVTELGGHKSLYSTSFYDREQFDELYNGAAYRELKRSYDPDGRLAELYDKCVLNR